MLQKDSEKAMAEKTKLVGYLTREGFAQNDVLGASDHRLIVMARKAMLFDELQVSSKAAMKKVAALPKVMKPGASKPQSQVSTEKLQQARARLQKSGSLDDAFALLKAQRGVN